MRTITRHFVLSIWILLSIDTGAYSQEKKVLSLVVENATGEYTVTVGGENVNQTLEIVMDKSGSRAPVSHYVSGGLVYARPIYAESDRLATVWQPGVVLTVAIFRLAPPSGRQEIIFEGDSVIQPDLISGNGGGDFILLYSGKRFVRKGFWVPVTATIYQWDGRVYRAARTVPYES